MPCDEWPDKGCASNVKYKDEEKPLPATWGVAGLADRVPMGTFTKLGSMCVVMTAVSLAVGLYSMQKICLHTDHLRSIF